MVRIATDQGDIITVNDDHAPDAHAKLLRERGYAPASDGLWMPEYLVEQYEGELAKVNHRPGYKAPTPAESKQYPTAEAFGMK